MDAEDCIVNTWVDGIGLIASWVHQPLEWLTVAVIVMRTEAAETVNRFFDPVLLFDSDPRLAQGGQ